MTVTLKAGDKVTYCPKYGDKEKGIVKSIGEHGHAVFVVYRCGNNWDRYFDYTAALTNIEDLKEGWIETPKDVMLFSNGNVACFDNRGEQMGELQKGWLEIWLEWMESKGVNPLEINCIQTIVNGRNVFMQPFKTTDDSWNVKIIDNN